MVEVGAEDQRGIVEFVCSRVFKQQPANSFVGLGAYKDRKLIGGFIYTSYAHIHGDFYSLEMHMAGGDGWLTRRTLRQFFAFPFIARKCSRVVGPVLRENTISANMCKRLGCKLDGVLRSGIAAEHDLMLWTMTRADCPWI